MVRSYVAAMMGGYKEMDKRYLVIGWYNRHCLEPFGSNQYLYDRF